MNLRYKPTADLVIPPTTRAVLMPSSWQPSFTQDRVKFPRVAYDAQRDWLVTERIDPHDAP